MANQTPFDASTLHQRPPITETQKMIDDGNGQKQIWRIHQSEALKLPKIFHGEFFMGDCYIVVYSCTKCATENYIIYNWIGSDAKSEEADIAVTQAMEFTKKKNGSTVQIQVDQGQESSHFMAIFSGKMLIYKGRFASTFGGSTVLDQNKKVSHMFQVRSTSSLCIKAIEVDFRVGALNSNDCFVISTSEDTFVWYGKGSSDVERKMAKIVAKTRGDPISISEGSEKSYFWTVLGGEEQYACSKILKKEKPKHPPRLFHCSNASGTLIAQEVFDFNQNDLNEDDVMLLDVWKIVFIWIGKHSNREEHQGSVNIAKEYLQTDSAKRKTETTIVQIKQSFEPSTFTGYFGHWNNSLWNNNETYSDVCKRLKETSPGVTNLFTLGDILYGRATNVNVENNVPTIVVTNPGQ